jgi:uncharacterized protein
MPDALDIVMPAESTLPVQPRRRRQTWRSVLPPLIALFSVVFVVAALHHYIATGLSVFAPFSTAVVWGGFAAAILGLAGNRILPKGTTKVLHWVGFVWLGAFWLLLSALVATDVLALGLSVFGALPTEWHDWRGAGLMAVLVPSLAVGFWVSQRPRVKTVEVLLPRLHQALDGFRIVQLSDIHLGETLGRSFAQRLVEEVNGLRADVIAVTGDAVDGSVQRVKHDIAPFADLRSRHGLFFVTGNHEYYHGAEAWMDHWRHLGHTVLHNEHVVLNHDNAYVTLAGVSDLQGGRFFDHHRPSAARAFQNAPQEGVRVLLAHQPKFAADAQGHGVDLMLSGHTHGGQMFPFMFLVKLQQPMLSGLKRLGDVLTYTSTGTGYWGPPFRLGPQGEITVLVLKRIH